MKKLLILILCTACVFRSTAQRDTSLFKRILVDTSQTKMNLDAIYNRPLVQIGKIPATLGGYFEANTSYFATDGVSEGLSFQVPRLTLFISSTVRQRIKFLTEIEFEEGGKEINIEFASVDVEFHPLLNFRGGIIMNPIGAFNQNHDGPKWEFISRPYSATTIIPSTFSNAGFGFYGKYAKGRMVYAYEAYLSNGFDNSIVANNQGRTWLPASKNNPERFEESFNGQPLVTLKGAVKHQRIGEAGISWMGGVYNKFQDDGLELDKKRRVDLIAFDYNNSFKKTGTSIVGEWVFAFIDVPGTYSPQFGKRQQGGFLDIVQPVIKGRIFGWERSTVNVAVRGEFADYNAGRFDELNTNISDHVIAVVPAISFRPSAQTVFRANYRYEWRQDLLGNKASKTAGFQFGLSTYF